MSIKQLGWSVWSMERSYNSILFSTLPCRKGFNDITTGNPCRVVFQFPIQPKYATPTTSMPARAACGSRRINAPRTILLLYIFACKPLWSYAAPRTIRIHILKLEKIIIADKGNSQGSLSTMNRHSVTSAPPTTSWSESKRTAWVWEVQCAVFLAPAAACGDFDDCIQPFLFVVASEPAAIHSTTGAACMRRPTSELCFCGTCRCRIFFFNFFFVWVLF